MGKSTGSTRAYAKRNGFTLSKLAPNQTSGGKYKYAIRGNRSNMRAPSLDSARRLMASTIRANKDFQARLAGR